MVEELTLQKAQQEIAEQYPEHPKTRFLLQMMVQAILDGANLIYHEHHASERHTLVIQAWQALLVFISQKDQSWVQQFESAVSAWEDISVGEIVIKKKLQDQIYETFLREILKNLGYSGSTVRARFLVPFKKRMSWQ